MALWDSIVHNSEIRQKYDELIENAQQNPYDGYIEKHHIIPKSLGGSHDVSNIIRLRARDHFIAHILLAEMFPLGTIEHNKMSWALHKMIGSNKNDVHGKLDKYEITPNEYEKARLIHVENLSNLPVETRKKLGDAVRGKEKSFEHKRKIQEANKKTWANKELRAEHKLHRKNYNYTKETREKMSLSAKRRVARIKIDRIITYYVQCINVCYMGMLVT